MPHCDERRNDIRKLHMAKKKASETIDVVFSFDTTGSMYPCLTQVRREVAKTVKMLFKAIPNIRIGIISHGDYCDGDDVITMLDLTSDEEAICDFIKTAPSTNGGDSDECYEFVLNRARTLSWTSGKNKALVMIGDANPHMVGYRHGSIKNDLDWKNELGLLLEAGVSFIPMQALGRRDSNRFYEGMAEIAGSPKLELDQFSDVTDIIKAICFDRAERLSDFEQILEKRGNVSYNVMKAVDQLAGRKASRPKRTRTISKAHGGLTSVHPSRFQLLTVDKDTSIKDFVTANGLKFKRGKGFYEFTKRVLVQEHKEVVIQDKGTGEMFTGDEARDILDIPVGERAKVSPMPTSFTGFIQSTSNNRKLLAGTKFLYEVDDHE